MPSPNASHVPPPLRVLLVAPTPPPYGGMALQAQLLARLLREDGQVVDFFPSNFPLPVFLAPIGRIPGIRTLLRALFIAPKLWLQCRRADIVHVFAASWLYFFLVVWPAAIVGRLCGRRTIVNYRGGEAGRFFNRFGALARPPLQMATAVMSPSAFLSKLIGDRFGIAVAIVPNIVDLSRFQFRERATFAPAMLVTRHLEPMYDIESVIRAFGSVQRRFPEASLAIAGTGSQESYLRELVDSLCLNHVRFLGHVPQADLAGVYASCDIYVNASRVDNFPGALIEASASGLAVVTTDAGGIPCMYDHERTALMVRTGDWEALAQQIERVVDNPGESAAMVAAAARDARRCEWSEVRRALYKVYGVSAGEAALNDGPVMAQQRMSAS